VSDATQMIEHAIRRLRETYDGRPFFVERDVDYSVQLLLWQRIRDFLTTGQVTGRVRGPHGLLPVNGST
jgi:hypothetical protein